MKWDGFESKSRKKAHEKRKPMKKLRDEKAKKKSQPTSDVNNENSIFQSNKFVGRNGSGEVCVCRNVVPFFLI